MTQVPLFKLHATDQVEFGIDTGKPSDLKLTSVETALGAHLNVQASEHVTVAAKVASIFGNSPAGTVSVKITF